MTNRLEIVLPHQQIFMTQFGVLEAENPHLRLIASKEALYISGKNFALENRDFFTLHVNNQFHLNDSFIDAFLAENQHIKPEFILPGKIIINMLTPEMIAAFSMAIGAILFIWNRSSKKGRIYDGTARFDIEINRETYIEKQRRAPDFSFVSLHRGPKSAWLFVLTEKNITFLTIACITAFTTFLKLSGIRNYRDWN